MPDILTLYVQMLPEKLLPYAVECFGFLVLSVFALVMYFCDAFWLQNKQAVLMREAKEAWKMKKKTQKDNFIKKYVRDKTIKLQN